MRKCVRMGEIKNYRCNCGYEVRFFAGAGMRAHNRRLAEQMFPDVENLWKDAETIEQIFLDNVLVECKQCQTLQTTARLTYRTSGMRKSGCEIKDICETCGGKMFVHENEKNVKCPKCGNDMEYTRTGMWD